MNRCIECSYFSIDRIRRSLMVSNDEIANPEFIRDGRATCLAQNQRAEHWIEYVNDLYRDYPGCIVDGEGHRVSLNMEVFEREHIRSWFDDFANTPCPPSVKPRVRGIARPRVRVLLTIMRASFPEEAKHWGVREPANDNIPAGLRRHRE